MASSFVRSLRRLTADWRRSRNSNRRRPAFSLGRERYLRLARIEPLEDRALLAGTISGQVFNDVNASGINPGTTGLPGWTVFLDDNQNGVLDTGVATRSTGTINTPVPENSTVVSNFSVSGLGGSITDLNVRLNLYNTYDIAISVYLISPTGTQVKLFSGVGGSGRGFINTILDDGASKPITDPAAIAPFSGPWRPMELLSAFNGQSPNGDWKLQVISNVTGAGTGTLYDWSLTFSSTEISTTSSAVPATLGNYAFANLPAGTYYVAEVQQAGWAQTTPVSPRYHTVVVPEGGAIGGKDFGNYNGGWGVVWNDSDGDGIKESGELPLSPPDWTVQLDLGNDGTVDQIKTPDLATGMYSFGTVPLGTHKVSVAGPSGWTQTAPAAPGYYLVSVTQVGQAITGRNFGNFQLATISGVKFNDLNGDGVKGASETGLAGWTIQLDLNNNSTVDRTATTDLNGNYVFDSVAPGTHKVLEVAQAGWVATTPTAPGTHVVIVQSGVDVIDQDFGNFQLITISGQKFNDLDNDQMKDADEPGLAGWTINLDLYGNGGVPDRTAITDSNGNYSFTGVGPAFTAGASAPHKISETLQAGWTQTYPLAPGTYTITPVSGQNLADMDFGNRQTVTVTVKVWDDTNGNGINDNEPAVPDGWKVLLDLNNDGVGDLPPGLTAAGTYTFPTVPFGTHKLSEELQSGWVQTAPTGSGNYVFDIQDAGPVTGMDFGVFQLATISGQKFNDLNGDGTKGAVEPGLSGWRVFIDQDNDGVWDSTEPNDEPSDVTNATGNYAFTGLGPGTYVIDEVAQAGWVQTTPPAPGANRVTVASGGNAAGPVFGNFQLVTLSGQKFNDIDGDGVKDTGEPGVSGWTINLDLNDDTSVDRTATTDSSGNYSFANVGPGTHKVSEVAQAGWTRSMPAAGTYPILVASGQNPTGKDFGAYQLGSISGQKFNDLDGLGGKGTGEPGLADWIIQLDRNNDGTVDQATVTDANGNYTFAALVPGTYKLSEVAQTGWTQTAPATGTRIIILQSGLNPSAEDFGDFQLVTLSGQVFNDFNNYGVKDAGENGLAGWTIQLSLDPNGSVDRSTTTDASGNYTFADVPAGTYLLSQVAQDGWTQTLPLPPDTYTVIAQSGLNVAGKDFGYHLQNPPQQIVGDTDLTVSKKTGDPVSFPVRYTVSTGDNGLAGLGLRMHYDSTFMTFTSLSGVLSTNFVQQQPAADETGVGDGDSDTDKYVLISWLDESGNWPNTALPAQLFTANFVINAPAGEETKVNFSAASGAAGYDFLPRPVTVKAADMNLDADGNGTADALTDGMLILRYLFDPNGLWNYSDALGAGATRTTLATIRTFLDGGATTVLDADGNGTPDALTDGLLILRYLFDPAGSWNYSDALSTSAKRTNREAIKSALDLYNPAFEVTPPVASSVVAPTVNAGGGATYTFTVTYTDNLAVKVSSLDSSDVRVTGPNAFSQLATFVSVDVPTNGTPRVATYRITPPGGSWGSEDNGTYSVAVEAGQVKDTSGNAVAAGTYQTFNVSTEATPPTAVATLTDVSSGGGTSYTFTVAYSDNVAVKVSTLDSSDIRVTGPSLVNQLATLVSVDIGTDGTPRVATYRITPPGGSWGSEDNGTYTVAMEAGQVTDTSNNAVNVITPPVTFNVNIATGFAALPAADAVIAQWDPQASDPSQLAGLAAWINRSTLETDKQTSDELWGQDDSDWFLS